MKTEKEMNILVDRWFKEMHLDPYNDIRCSGDFTWDEIVEFGLWLEKNRR
jgi:hypothetical protein